MIYAVTIYNKNGKVRKRISPEQLSVAHWENFKSIEKSKKKFVKEKVAIGTHKLLREYQALNSMTDAVIFNPMKN